MPILTVDALCAEAQAFSKLESAHAEPKLFGVTDGKAVGTYLELKFRRYLIEKGYEFEAGNSASGLDFPGLQIDMKVTSIKKPQSSSPFRSLRQKIYGLGHGLIVFVYSKYDSDMHRTATLSIVDTIYVHKERTADYETTKGIIDILDSGGSEGDLIAFMVSKRLSEDEDALEALSKVILKKRPTLGYLTISPALQWRLQYKRVMDKAGDVDGVFSVYKA